MKNTYGLGSIEERIKWLEQNKDLFVDNDVSQESKDDIQTRSRMVFGSGSASQWYPESISYENEMSFVHNQGAYGTCWVECASALVEHWIWKVTGEKIQFSREEIWDIAGDGKGSSYKLRQKNKFEAIDSGWPEQGLKAIYNYNSKLQNHYFTNGKNSSNCQKFKNLVDKLFNGKNYMVFAARSSRISQDREQVINLLKQYGPICWTYCVNGVKAKNPGGHAVVLCKADKDKIYLRNSWGSANLVTYKYSSLSQYIDGRFQGLDIAIAKPRKNLS